MFGREVTWIGKCNQDLRKGFGFCSSFFPDMPYNNNNGAHILTANGFPGGKVPHLLRDKLTSNAVVPTSMKEKPLAHLNKYLNSIYPEEVTMLGTDLSLIGSPLFPAMTWPRFRVAKKLGVQNFKIHRRHDQRPAEHTKKDLRGWRAGRRCVILKRRVRKEVKLSVVSFPSIDRSIDSGWSPNFALTS